jgi:uncharacterized membrane protein
MKEVITTPHHTLQRMLPYLLFGCSLFGLIASFALTYDKLQILQNPSYTPNCNLSPILSCKSVMETPQANVFGMPNSVYGLVAFGMLNMFSIMLMAGAIIPRAMWRLLQVGMTGAIFAVGYLIFESAFQLHTICPWCFGVWVVTIAMFWAVTIRNLREGAFGYPHRRLGPHVIKRVEHCPGDILAAGYVLVCSILLVKFWYYWKTLI